MPELRKRSQQERPERLALCLFDIDRIDPTIRSMLLGGKLETDRNKIVRIDPDRMDETGVLLTCDLLTAACIADTIRAHDGGAGDPPTRVYLKRRGAWEKVPGRQALTLVVDGKPILNPSVFPAAGVTVRPPAVKRVVLGGG